MEHAQPAFSSNDQIGKYKQLLIENPYIFRKINPTFLSIAGFPAYETVISNLYAFFLSPDDERGFGITFMKHLLSEAGVALEFLGDFYTVERESYTKSGGFIDIACFGTQGILLIENKIYHHIKEHQLTDYLTDTQEQYKLPVKLIVLALHPMPELIGREGISFLSHRQALRISNSCIDYLTQPNQAFFQDLRLHMEQEFYTHSDSETISFLLKNGLEVERLKQAEASFKKQFLKWCEGGIPAGLSAFRRDHSSNYYTLLKTSLIGVWVYLNMHKLLSEHILQVRLFVSNAKYSRELNEYAWTDKVLEFIKHHEMWLEMDDFNANEAFAWTSLEVNVENPSDIVGRLEMRLSNDIGPFIVLLGQEYPFLNREL